MIDNLQLVTVMEAFRAERRLGAQFEAQPQIKLSDRGFEDLEVDLANADIAIGGGGYALKSRGYEMTFLRRGSTAGALLQLRGAGISKPFAPGDSVKGFFESGDIALQLAPGSVAAGRAILRVALQPQVSFREAPIEVPSGPVALLGTLINGVIGFQSVAEDVVPTGAASGVVGSFNIGGWKRVLVLVDCGPALDVTSFQVNPFYQVAGGTLWFDQGGTELVTIPDSNPTLGRYRMFELDLSQAQGSLYPAIRNLIGAATAVSFCVLGVL